EPDVAFRVDVAPEPRTFRGAAVLRAVGLVRAVADAALGAGTVHVVEHERRGRRVVGREGRAALVPELLTDGRRAVPEVVVEAVEVVVADLAPRAGVEELQAPLHPARTTDEADVAFARHAAHADRLARAAVLAAPTRERALREGRL